MSRQCVLPSMTAMFQYGMPSMDNLETVIADIDEQLSHNDKKIEETLQKLVQATNSLSLDNNYTNIKDAMDSLIQTPVLEECACLTPDAEDVNKLLKSILHHATSHPHSEGVIFEQLLGLAAHEGLGLPIRAPKPGYVAASMVSINTISDSLEQENDSLWEDIRSRLKRHFLDRLHAIELPLSPGKGDLAARAGQDQQVECLQSLCILYPIKEVWTSYQSMASEKVAHFLRENLKSTTALEPSAVGAASNAELRQPATLQSVATKLAELAPSFHAMLESECTLYMANVFEGEVAFLPAVQDTYLSKLLEEINTMMAEVRKGWSQQGGGASKGATANGNATKSIGASDWLNGGHEHLSKDHSKKQPSSGEGMALLNQADIQNIIAIATLLHELSQHLCELSQHATWDGTSLMKARSQKRGAIRGVLKHNRDGGPGRDSRGHSDYSGKGVLPEAIPPPFGVMPGMVGSDYTPQRSSPVTTTPAQQKNAWNWSRVFEDLPSLIIRSITKLCQDALKEDFAKEEDWMKREKRVVAVDCESLYGRPAIPYLVCQSAVTACRMINSVLPLVSMGTDKLLQPIRACVVDVMTTSLQEVYQHLAKMLEMYNQSSSEGGTSPGNSKDLCVLLSSVVWVLEELARYRRLVGEELVRHTFPAIEKQLGQLDVIMRQQIISSHMTHLSTVILHDAESHNWADQRPFYEDERCSYSVQMWHLYMGQLRHDLFSACPPSVSQDIFATVLSESLIVLSHRYSKAQPSYKRVRQFRADMTTILLSTLTHMWSVCSTPQQLLSPPSLLSAAPHFPVNAAPLNIHNAAMCLLATLAVGTAPLADLYKVYKKGYQKKVGAQPGGGGGQEADQRLWLAWIRPALFDQLEQGWNVLPDKTAVSILLKLLSCQPGAAYGLTLQTLLARDGLVAGLMMSNIGASVRYELSSILQPLMDVLVLCSDHPTGLTTVLMAVIEKQDNWPIFRFDSLPGKTTIVPDWLSCLHTILKPFITRGVEEAAGVLMQTRGIVEVSGFLETLGELPCGCRPKHRTAATPTHKQEKDVMYAALKVLLACIAEDSIAMPTPLKVFFYTLQEKLPNSVRSSHNCVALQVIGSCVYSTLSSEQEVRSIVGDSASDAVVKKFSQLGDYAFLCLTATSNHNTQEKLPNTVHAFITLHADWLQEQIDMIIDHLGNESLGELTNYHWEESGLDFVENYYTMQADHVIRMQAGAVGLLKITTLLRNNLDWFQHHLDILPLLQTNETPSIPMFNPDTNVPYRPIPGTYNAPPTTAPNPSPAVPSPAVTARSHFDPITAFNRIDDSPFAQEALAEFPYDWPRLLQSSLGLSEAGFRALLSRRWEMQEDAHLEEGERKPVRVLRSKFNLDRAELV